MRTAIRTDWETKPMPSRQTTIRLDRMFDELEMDGIRCGAIPEEMEDKWFIYFDDDRLYFHRSWTGFCVYIVDFAAQGRVGHHMHQAVLNREAEQYSETSDEFDGKMISYLIDVLLLHRCVEFPTYSDGNDTDPLFQWSQVGKAMLQDIPEESNHGKAEPTWRHADVFPVIERVIKELYKQKGDYLTHGEIADGLLNESDGAQFIQQALETSQKPHTAEWLAHNMVAWFSQRLSVGNSEWGKSLQRKKIDGKWAYRPRQTLFDE